MSTLRLPSFWQGMGFTAKAGYLCATHQAKDYSDACRILRSRRAPTRRTYPKPDPVAELERRGLW